MHARLSGGPSLRITTALLGTATTREGNPALRIHSGRMFLPLHEGHDMTTSTITLNDVDIAAVGALADEIAADPIKAHTTWNASVSWDGGFHTTTRIRDFAPIPTDEPEGLGGSDTAPNPVEQLLGALGSCLAIGYAANATAAGIRIDNLRIDVEGDLNLKSFLGLEPGHAGYDTLRASVHIESDATDDAIAALHETVVATSPVGHTLAGAIPLTVDLK